MTLDVSESGDYRFMIEGARKKQGFYLSLYIDGALVVNARNSDLTPGLKDATVSLSEGIHTITLQDWHRRWDKDDLGLTCNVNGGSESDFFGRPLRMSVIPS